MKVYLLWGWFGDQEWLEGVYASEADAKNRCAELWTTRSSEKGPEYSRRLHKFGVEPEEVIQKSDVP